MMEPSDGCFLRFFSHFPEIDSRNRLLGHTSGMAENHLHHVFVSLQGKPHFHFNHQNIFIILKKL